MPPHSSSTPPPSSGANIKIMSTNASNSIASKDAASDDIAAADSAATANALAIVKVQAFVRGCQTRAAVSDLVGALIAEMMKLQELQQSQSKKQEQRSKQHKLCSDEQKSKASASDDLAGAQQSIWDTLDDEESDNDDDDEYVEEEIVDDDDEEVIIEEEIFIDKPPSYYKSGTIAQNQAPTTPPTSKPRQFGASQSNGANQSGSSSTPTRQHHPIRNNNVSLTQTTQHQQLPENAVDDILLSPTTIRDRKKAFWSAASRTDATSSIRKLEFQQNEDPDSPKKPVQSRYPPSSPKKENMTRLALQPKQTSSKSVLNRYPAAATATTASNPDPLPIWTPETAPPPPSSTKSVLNRYNPAPSQKHDAKKYSKFISDEIPFTSAGSIANRYNPKSSNASGNDGVGMARTANIGLPNVNKRNKNKSAWTVFGETVKTKKAQGDDTVATAAAKSVAEGSEKDDYQKNDNKSKTNMTVEVKDQESKDSAQDVEERPEDDGHEQCGSDASPANSNAIMNELENKSVASDTPVPASEEDIVVEEEIIEEVVEVNSHGKDEGSNSLPSFVDDGITRESQTDSSLQEVEEIDDEKTNLAIGADAPIVDNAKELMIISDESAAEHPSDKENENPVQSDSDDQPAPMVAAPSLDMLAHADDLVLKASSARGIAAAVSFDETPDVREFKSDVAAEHTDRLPIWWLECTPHDILNDNMIDSELDIGYYNKSGGNEIQAT